METATTPEAVLVVVVFLYGKQESYIAVGEAHLEKKLHRKEALADAGQNIAKLEKFVKKYQQGLRIYRKEARGICDPLVGGGGGLQVM